MNAPLKTIGLSVLAAVAFSGCQKVTQERTYTANDPIYLSYEDLRSSIKNVDDAALENPGKIFLYNQYILINEFEKGIHIYDNSNPASPEHVAFISIPGNVDMAVRNDVLYADSYVDIVAIDLSNPNEVREIGRSENALSYTIPSTMDYSYPVATIDESKGVIIGYTIREVTENCTNDECGYVYYDWRAATSGTWEGDMMTAEGSVVSFAGNTNNVRSASSSNNTAIAGSMARFMMIENYLYAISDASTVKVFDIATPNMSEVTSFNPWEDSRSWGNIETLFTFSNHLFIGSNSGMLAYDVTNPASPDYLSFYTHLTSCDPVVANDDYAFVTLRSGNNCGFTNTDQLDIMDISDIMNPFQVNTVSLTNPYGLSLDNDNNLLFVCDGSNGLIVYNVSDVNDLDRVASQSGSTYDVITHRDIAHVVGDDGLVQYQYDATGQLIKLSSIDLN